VSGERIASARRTNNYPLALTAAQIGKLRARDLHARSGPSHALVVAPVGEWSGGDSHAWSGLSP